MYARVYSMLVEPVQDVVVFDAAPNFVSVFKPMLGDSSVLHLIGTRFHNRGISVISSFKPTAAAIKSTLAKHQISFSNSCFPQLLFNRPPATAASQQQQPKQTDPKKVRPAGRVKL